MVRAPDIVLVMTDQQRHDQVGFASAAQFTTPALDGLARDGVVFCTAYSAAATCIPARVGLLTGVQPRRLPTQPGTIALKEGVWTVAHGLRAAGYETALIGKMHFTPAHAEHGFDVMRTSEHIGASVLGERPDGSPDVDDYHQWLVDQGVARWASLQIGSAPVIEAIRPPDAGRAPFPFHVRYHDTTWVEQEVVAFIDQRRTDRPLFLVVSFPHPHTPLNPLGPYAAELDPAGTVLPAREHPGVTRALPEAFRDALEGNGGKGWRPWRVDERGEDALWGRQAKVRALVHQLDDAIGRLLPRFPLDQTVVAFTSDHGDYAGHRGLAGKVPWIPFDDLIRVPLVLAGPGIPAGRTVTSVVQSCDLPLTLCELAGAALPAPTEDFDSFPLTPYLGDGAPPTRDDRAARFLYNSGWPGVRLGPMKLIAHPPSGAKVLFDLERDPEESRDLSDDPEQRDTLAELEAIVRDGLAQPPPVEIAEWGARHSASVRPG